MKLKLRPLIKKEVKAKMFNLDLNVSFDDIDFDNIGDWPVLIKILAVILVCGVIYFLCNWIFISSNYEHLQTLKAEEQKQRIFFVSKQKMLFDIKDYKKQIGTIEKRLSKLTQKLPAENEVPELINQISQAGYVSDLSFKEIKILPEKKFKYYVELPIHISVVGNYHQLGEFISKVSSMPRVITFHDFTIEELKQKPGKKQEPTDKLDMVVLAKTYRYLKNEDEEEKESSENTKKKT